MVIYSQLGNLGRLGNSMFQIAATIGYARMYGMDYLLPRWQYAQHFKYGFNQADILPPYPRYQEKQFAWSKIPRQNRIDLYGYFQSRRYWQHCEPEIRRMFQPNDTIQAILDKSPVAPNTCAIHVRRTDYIGLQDYHRVLPVEYYREAMKLMGAEQYWVFSDDPEACKDMFAGTNALIINSGNDIQDWFMMRMCDKFIIANSSFSWWSSYLSDRPSKRIMAPKKDMWFGRKYHHNNVNDLYLPEWELV